MTDPMIEELKEDFMRWSGGFPPDSTQQIFTYVELAASIDLDPNQVWIALLDWMAKAEFEPYEGEKNAVGDIADEFFIQVHRSVEPCEKTR